MNEQACAAVCAFLSAICCILYSRFTQEEDWGAMVVSTCFAVIIAPLSSYVLMCKYL